MTGLQRLGMTLGVILTAAAASAQVVAVDDANPRGDILVSAGIQGPSRVNQVPDCVGLGLPCETPPTAPDVGIAIAVSAYPANHVGLVAETGVATSPWSAYSSSCPGYDAVPCVVSATDHIRAVVAGMRVRTDPIGAGRGRFRLFAELLAGPEWSSVGHRGGAVQTGVGADDYLGNGMVLRVQYAYRYTPNRRSDLSFARYSVGIGVPVGPR